MTDELILMLAQHSHGNLRALMNLANELLQAAHLQNADALDEKLYFELEKQRTPATPRPTDSRRRSRSRA